MFEDWNGCVGKGWRLILDSLDSQFTQILKSARLNSSEKGQEVSINIDCVKEKFGELRVYITPINLTETFCTELYSAIDMAGEISRRICEDCGATKDVETKPNEGKYWVRTLCKACRA